MNTNFTVGKILQALKTEIFEDGSNDHFISKCREREKEIKRAIEICGKMIEQHTIKPGLSGKPSYWKSEKIKDNLRNIFAYTAELYHKLNRDAIEKHVKNRKQLLFHINLHEDPDLIFLTLHSYYGSILIDLNWIADMPFKITLGLATGNIELNEIGKLLPKRIEDIKKFIDDESELMRRYQSAFDSIIEVINCYEKKYNRAFNVLAIVTIESLVRQFGEYLIEKQELEVDLRSDVYNSLNNFLRKIPWKDKIEYTREIAMLWSSSSFKAKENKTEIEEWSLAKENGSKMLFSQGVKLNFKERLDFLRRRFKEDRDLILHGQEEVFDEEWQCFINASALFEVLKAMKEFTTYYEEKTVL